MKGLRGGGGGERGRGLRSLCWRNRGNEGGCSDLREKKERMKRLNEGREDEK